MGEYITGVKYAIKDFMNEQIRKQKTAWNEHCGRDCIRGVILVGEASHQLMVGMHVMMQIPLPYLDDKMRFDFERDRFGIEPLYVGAVGTERASHIALAPELISLPQFFGHDHDELCF
jgi:hypothetical protein